MSSRHDGSGHIAVYRLQTHGFELTIFDIPSNCGRSQPRGAVWVMGWLETSFMTILSLHWLLVNGTMVNRQRTNIQLLVYKCFHQLATSHLVPMITPVAAVSTRHHLRSAGQGDLIVRRTTGPELFTSVHELSFPVAGLMEQSATGDKDGITDTHSSQASSEN